jgi:thiol-disulfide isomerase/thioredoxin
MHQIDLRTFARLLFSAVLFTASAAATTGITQQPPDKKPDGKQSPLVADFLAIKNDVDAKGQKIDERVLKMYEAAANADERAAANKLYKQESATIVAPAVEKVMALVRPHAGDPAAVEMLIWVVSMQRGSAACNEAAELLTKHHVTHKKTIQLASKHLYDPQQWVEPMLRAQLAAADLPKADKAIVLYTLAVIKQGYSRWPALLAAASDEIMARWVADYGKEGVEGFRGIDVAKTEAEAIALFTELAEKYGSAKTRGGQPYSEFAKSAIFEIQHLSVGKTAPDIIGEDPDGVKFKLSDYRGKVVMLSFWGTWCGPCMALVPQEREIVERLKDKPFVLIGVNSDADKTKLKDIVAKEKITWRSFWCGDKGTNGEIPTAWNVRGWPTIYIIDHNGVIRANHGTDKSMESVIDRLISEADAKK